VNDARRMKFGRQFGFFSKLTLENKKRWRVGRTYFFENHPNVNICAFWNN
jgi:hypothetical protein